MNFPRASGVLLHPTSLPSNFGIGDFGAAAYKFVDFLLNARQTYWQILPLGPTGYGDSPYQCFSAFAGNTNLISPEKIVEDGFLIKSEILINKKFPARRVDYGAVQDYKKSLLEKAFERFKQTTDANIIDQFHRFCDENAFWLEDYALFRAAKDARKHASWQEFEMPLKMREPEALEAEKRRLDDECFAEKFYQFLFFKQWFALKNYANERGIKIVGDVPIFVALDSADVWQNPSQFKLNADGSARVVAGVPPDFFSTTGQLWGNPIYDWEAMRADGFRWWTDRVRATLKTVDIVRVDHFRGFAAAWEVAGADKTAENGEWIDVPGRELFDALKNAFGDLPFWAEDLGVMTPDVENLRDAFGFPGMRILQYAFSGDASNRDLPHNYIKNTVAYTGTHDNETVAGWFASRRKNARNDANAKSEKDFCLNYLNSDGREIHWDFVRAAWSSVADTAIAPMQDLLGLDNKARMNLPASKSGNWYWQCADGDFSDAIAKRLREITEIYGRF